VQEKEDRYVGQGKSEAGQDIQVGLVCEIGDLPRLAQQMLEKVQPVRWPSVAFR
jgi:hypothetical protein